jgi:hypothetical protein
VNTAELQQLVAEIGAEILARTGRSASGCWSCAQACTETWSAKTQEIAGAGATVHDVAPMRLAVGPEMGAEAGAG